MIRLDERPAENRPLAIALALAAYLTMASADAVVKTLVTSLPPIEVQWIRNIVVVCVTLPVAYFRAGKIVFFPHRPVRQILRGTALMGSSLFFMTGLQYLALADAVAINFIWPIMITVFSVVFMGEKVGIRRFLATIVGFLGMLLIVRPGSSSFQAASIFPLLGAVLWAATNLMTRSLAVSDPPETTILWSGLVMLVGSTIMLPFVWVTPTPYLLFLGVVAGFCATIGHTLIVFALERSSASTLAPISYVQLVWAGLIGFFVFNTIPDGWMLAGASLIVVSGLYTVHRERVRARTAPEKASEGK